jgi:hypothetical protein
MPLNRVHNLGMALDKKQRVTMARVDNYRRRSKVSAARRVIYEKNYLVDGAAVDKMLKEMSLVPTAVRRVIID